MVIYTWKTQKVGKSFDYKVLKLIPRTIRNKNGYFVDSKIIKTGNFPTRVRAKGQAQRWVRYYKGANKI